MPLRSKVAVNITIAIVAIIDLAAIAALQSTLRAQQATSRSVLDGAYTEEQAKRGEALYGQHCVSCHGPTLMGTEMAPPLTGAAFNSNWNDQTVNDVFEKIRGSMPGDDPGKLSRPETAAVLAYILSVDKFPAGKTELESKTELLKQIRFEPPRP